jgi:hypothetical protein
MQRAKPLFYLEISESVCLPIARSHSNRLSASLNLVSACPSYPPTTTKEPAFYHWSQHRSIKTFEIFQ